MVLSVLVLASACGPRAEVSSSKSTNASLADGVEKIKQDAKHAVTTTKTYLIQQKEQFQKGLSGKISEFDKQLSELKSKTTKAGEHAKSEWTGTLAELQKKRQAAADRLEQLKNSSTEKWRDFKAGVDAAFADLENSMKDAFTRLKGNEPSGKQ